MIGRFSRTTPRQARGGEQSRTTWLVLATALLLAGCGQERKEGMGFGDTIRWCPPKPPDYVSGAIVATGGLQEWVKTRKLELDGVVALYQGDGSVYLTEQRYQIYPWSNSIRVSAVEPQGEFVCELSGFGDTIRWCPWRRPDELQDGFRVRFDVAHRPELVEGLASGTPSDGVPKVDAPRQPSGHGVPAEPGEHSGISERDLADAILTITTASIRFLDRSAPSTRREPLGRTASSGWDGERSRIHKFTRASEPVKMQGLWYYPIERAYVVERPTTASGRRRDVESPEPYWSEVVFYQNRDNSLVDMVWFADRDYGRAYALTSVEEGKFFAVRGYDYSRVQKRGVLLPAKIEIFRTDARGALSERVAQVNFE